MLGSSTFKALAISPSLIYGFGKLALTWKMKKKQIYEVQTYVIYFMIVVLYRHVKISISFFVWVAFKFMSLIRRQESLNRLLTITLNFKGNIKYSLAWPLIKYQLFFILNVNKSFHHIATYMCVYVCERYWWCLKSMLSHSTFGKPSRKHDKNLKVDPSIVSAKTILIPKLVVIRWYFKISSD